jgi:hypothetical protein
MPAARFGSRAREKMIKTSTEKFKFPTDLITLFAGGERKEKKDDRGERKTRTWNLLFLGVCLGALVNADVEER